MSPSDVGWDHPWERRLGPVWRIAELVAATLVVGSVVVAGVSLPVLLPAALAAAARVAVVRARGRASHPLGDAIAGVREDLRALMPLLLAGAVMTALLTLGVHATGSWATDARTGALVASSVAGVALGGWLAIGLTLGVASETSARSLPAAAALVATTARRLTALSGASMMAGLAMPLVTADPAMAIVGAGATVLLAIRVAWRAVEHVVG